MDVCDMKILLRKYHYVNDIESSTIEIEKSDCPYI